MLQDLIKDLQSTLKNYIQGLAKQNLLVDIPWTMVDGNLNPTRTNIPERGSSKLIKLCFKYNTWRKIILSKATI
ncbi:MAG: hypothetical protein P8O16_04750 [Algoriphagus sp.]|uniref:hypothetical protein n=1 Tax=Algoriphagus sp. TaxID=1872435 RepID=UPI002619B4E5|nr:hypothetical protein [Algoriphagus sp.]MDG1276567.1 hypothetical protein [Algoriphagus sp.]